MKCGHPGQNRAAPKPQRRGRQVITSIDIAEEIKDSTVVLPPERFSDAYEPADPKFAGERRGQQAGEISSLLFSCCAGWKQAPTAVEFYEAMRSPKPTQRQEMIINVLITEAPNSVVALAFLQGAFTWRQLAQAMQRRGQYSARLARYVNLHAERST